MNAEDPAATVLVAVDTPEGPARFHLSSAAEPQAMLIMGHGAGGGVDAADLTMLATDLPAQGITVARFEQPWRTAGKKVASPPPRLDRAWQSAVATLLADRSAGAGHEPVPYFFGGRSAGARVACRTAADFAEVAGIVCCAFPLHPPGRPDRSRAAELLAPAVPRLVLQGERDPFGGGDEVRVAAAADPAVTVIEVPAADHSMKINKKAPITADGLRRLLVDAVRGFLLG